MKTSGPTTRTSHSTRCCRPQRPAGQGRAIVAVLHDVVENSNWTFDRLREAGFTEEVVAAVDYLTKREGESYARRIEHTIREGCGLGGQLDSRRLPRVAAADHKRLEKYRCPLVSLREW